MNLHTKVTLFFVVIAAALLAVLVAISLYAFRSFSIASATDHIRTAGEIVRVHLTESMINGVIDKRESFLKRLVEVNSLRSARVVRSPDLERQFGPGLNLESTPDELERRVMADGKASFVMLSEGEETIFRGTIPYIASSSGTPNCLQCHQVPEGTVLGAVSMTMSIDALRIKALTTVAGIAGAVTVFALLLVMLMRRLLRPISETAHAVEDAVHRALEGDFKAHVVKKTNDEIGQIANDMNRLLSFLDTGLNRIGMSVAKLTERTATPGENLLTATIEMVDGLAKAAHFKQAIEEDETKAEIYSRLSTTLQKEFALQEFSLYEITTNKKQMKSIIVDGEGADTCRWCDPQILIRPEACRVRRTGHVVNSIDNPDICYAFQPPPEFGARRHVCFPIIQSGSVGSIVQVISRPEDEQRIQDTAALLQVYLRETAPVLETKRLMESLRDSTLRDPMTGLNNRRFLEEYVETLVASVQRKGAHVAILMLDLDYFKMVNDTHGHDAGDAVIKALANVLKQAVRASDLVIRYGGEEFLIVLLESSAEQAFQIGEKIRAAVEALKIQVGTLVLQKTISIGIADFPGDSATFWQAVKFADIALYQAKDQGRNRVIRFKSEMWASDDAY
ncbi:diguanylate cyclase [Azonexus sp.]|uniref:diguanylate cyclase n=1 Tax=Azonexus sp. TaxID=1872668 RepID=UPI0027BAF823|nr:diguanylate cyclase [Azonexus sp.]